MAQAAEQQEETVGITNHATDRTDGGDKSKCRLPESVIEKVVLQRKGCQYLDLEEDSIHFIYNSTVIVADYDPGQNEWTVITVYRDPAAEAKRRGTRYEEIDVDKVVEQARQS